MTELDPYAVLGVPRSATREEIARVYRARAKQHHPDVNTTPTPHMARINEAWRTLSDAGRRAQWDRSHSLAAARHWAPAPPPSQPFRRPTAAPDVPPSPMDSGRVVIGVLAGVGLLLAVLMIGISAASQPADERLRFTSGELSFAYPPDWSLTPGDATDPVGHRVLAHIVTFAVEPAQLCTSFARPCELTGDAIPPGHASIVISAWEGGTPPVPDPVVSRPFGLDADAIIDGQPAASEYRRAQDGTLVAWWQLSPPGFPDRWIEIRADISGPQREQDEMLSDVENMLSTAEFEDWDGG